MNQTSNQPKPDILAKVRADLDTCEVPVRDDIAQAHATFLTRLAQPGTWWTGAERVALAAEARAAVHCDFCSERKAALSAYTLQGTHTTAAGSAQILPEIAIDAVHRIIRDATRIIPRLIEMFEQAGLTDGHYVEALGIAVSIRSLDQVCRGLGVAPHTLPSPVPGKPSHYRPQGLKTGESFVPMLGKSTPAPPNDDLWTTKNSANVYRAMSLVPDAVRDLTLLASAQYLTPDQLLDLNCGRTLNRAQIETVAARVSAINECFY